MTRVSVSELKARLSHYLREVGRGGEIQVIARGVPVARLTGVRVPGGTDERRRERLVTAGIVRPGRGDASAVLARPPLSVGSVDLREALDEERDGGP